METDCKEDDGSFCLTWPVGMDADPCTGTGKASAETGAGTAEAECTDSNFIVGFPARSDITDAKGTKRACPQKAAFKWEVLSALAFGVKVGRFFH